MSKKPEFAAPAGFRWTFKRTSGTKDECEKFIADHVRRGYEKLHFTKSRTKSFWECTVRKLVPETE